MVHSQPTLHKGQSHHPRVLRVRPGSDILPVVRPHHASPQPAPIASLATICPAVLSTPAAIPLPLVSTTACAGDVGPPCHQEGLPFLLAQLRGGGLGLRGSPQGWHDPLPDSQEESGQILSQRNRPPQTSPDTSPARSTNRLRWPHFRPARKKRPTRFDLQPPTSDDPPAPDQTPCAWARHAVANLPAGP